jgi:hypothetical protein
MCANGKMSISLSAIGLLISMNVEDEVAKTRLEGVWRKGVGATFHESLPDELFRSATALTTAFTEFAEVLKLYVVDDMMKPFSDGSMKLLSLATDDSNKKGE